MVCICTICTDVLDSMSDMPCCIPCGHTFHTQCLRAWLNVGTTCPLCKKSTRKELIISPLYISTDEDVNNKTNEELKKIAITEKSKRKTAENILEESRMANKWLKAINDKQQKEIKDMGVTYNRDLNIMKKHRDDINEKLIKVKTKLEGKIDILRNERNDLSSQLVKLKSTVSARQSTIDNLKTYADKVSAQLASAVMEMDVKNKKLKELRMENLDISTKLNTAEVTVNLQQASINALQSTRDTLGELLTKNDALVNEKETEIRTLSTERRDINFQLFNAKGTIRIMQAEIDMWKRLSLIRAGLLPLIHSPTTSFPISSYLFPRLQLNNGKTTGDNSLQLELTTKQAENHAKSNTLESEESRSSSDDFTSALLDNPWKSVKSDHSVQKSVDLVLAESGGIIKSQDRCGDTIESKKDVTKSDCIFRDVDPISSGLSTLVHDDTCTGAKNTNAYISKFGGFTYRGYYIGNSEIKDTSVSASTS